MRGAGARRDGRVSNRFENRSLLAALQVQTDEAQAARHRAELASLAKSQFLAAASHDLRQPLYALSLFFRVAR
ncbi:MAG: histidine kinase dimerization/phospho-acceptor domain-containing protein [Rhodospirillales bacterium]